MNEKIGARKKQKRVGRGNGSGWGGTAGRGHKGQLSRSGASIRVGFEGGQMPLQRRMPKRGFKNYCRKEFAVVHIGDLVRFEQNAVVDPAAMFEAGLIRRVTDLVKVLADGELDKAIVVHAQGFSQAAKKKIEAAGGKAEIVGKVRKAAKSTP
ncbi:MAG: 50S ribosomal protein L15 [Deltaproteobacteria bacterium]|nr:50S ribosomal protein L15 [Deltaproteobacteria bacterium]